jgi:hypothetical protein
MRHAAVTGAAAGENQVDSGGELLANGQSSMTNGRTQQNGNGMKNDARTLQKVQLVVGGPVYWGNSCRSIKHS